MLKDLWAVAQNVLTLFILIGVGAVCRRTRLLNEEAVKCCASVVLYIATPCVILGSCMRAFDRALLDAKIPRLGSTVYADRAQQIAEAVQKILPLLRAVEGAQIVSHRIDGDVRTVGYDNGATVIVNFGEAAAETAHGSVAARSFSVVAKEEKR